MMAASAQTPHLGEGSEEKGQMMYYFIPVQGMNQDCCGFMEPQIPGAAMMDQMAVGDMVLMQQQHIVDEHLLDVSPWPSNWEATMTPSQAAKAYRIMDPKTLDDLGGAASQCYSYINGNGDLSTTDTSQIMPLQLQPQQQQTQQQAQHAQPWQMPQQMQPQLHAQQPQQHRYGVQQQQQHQQPQQQQHQPSPPPVVAGSPGDSAPGFTAAPARRKGLTNKRMEKLGTASVAAEASVASTALLPAAEVGMAPAAATMPPSAQALSGQEISAAETSPAHSTGGSGGGGSTPHKWPPLRNSNSQSSTPASSIKALSLEPANPQRLLSQPLRLSQSTLRPQQQLPSALQPSLGPMEELAVPQPVASSPQQQHHQLALAQPAMQPQQHGQQPPAMLPQASPMMLHQISPQQQRQQPPVMQQQSSPQQLRQQSTLADSKRPTSSGSKLVNKKLAKPGANPKASDGTEALKDKDQRIKDSATQEMRVFDSLAVMDSKPSLKPADGICDKILMLRIWRTTKFTHPQVLGLHTQPRTSEKPTPASDRMRKPPQTPNPPRPKATQAPSTPAETLERRVRSLLNKICPDNLQAITEQLAAIELKNVLQLETIIKLIFGVALADPHYCETYADMVFTLKSRYPEFPAEREGEKAVTFARALLNSCQNEFESLPTTFEPTDEERGRMDSADLARELQKRKKKMLANMKFIGHLFLRQLLTTRVIGQVVHELIGIKEGLPEEHMIECTCELLCTVGYTLDLTQNGKALMSQFVFRLVDLKRSKTSDDKAFAFSSRVRFQIQNLIDLRGNGWQRKLFREAAKTKGDVKSDAIKQAQAMAQGAGTDVMFAMQVVGQRPAYIENKPAPRAQPARAPFDLGYVRKILGYFSEERAGDSLEQDWRKASPSLDESKQGLNWLCEIGINDPHRGDVAAAAITELIARQCVRLDALTEALSGFLSRLEDLLVDVPMASGFFEGLLARLLALGPKFDPSVLAAVLPRPGQGGDDRIWQLLVGTLRRLKEKSGSEAVERAMAFSELSSTACKARRCTSLELRDHLRDEDAL